MKTFYSKRIYEENESKTISVTRTRNTSGENKIHINLCFPNCNEQSLIFSNYLHKDNYERYAKETVEMLDKIVSDPCLIDANDK